MSENFQKHTQAQKEEMDGIAADVHKFVRHLPHAPERIVPALMVLVAGYVGTSDNTTDDIVEQFRLCVEQARKEGRFKE